MISSLITNPPDLYILAYSMMYIYIYIYTEKIREPGDEAEHYDKIIYTDSVRTDLKKRKSVK